NTWFNAAISMNKPWAEKLHDVAEEVHRALQKLQQIEEETGLTIEQVKGIKRRMPFDRMKACSAQEKMVEADLRLVVFIAKKNNNRALQMLHLLQDVNIDLHNAVDKFVHRRRYKLSTYATFCTRQAVYFSPAVQQRPNQLPMPTIAPITNPNPLL
ncbi:RNA polymerase sigma factor RpoD, partial [Escherichia coli]|uniref:sigma factor n=1 Tax=Escherichia coli TaxID=562 RepID=UPI001EBC4B84